MTATTHRNDRGSALIAATSLTVVLLGFGLTVMTTVGTATREQGSIRDQMQRLFIAETGVRAAVLDLTQGGDGNFGAARTFGGGSFQVTTVDNGDGSYIVTSRGDYGGGRRVIQARVTARDHVFNHAIFAGNSSGDLGYSLDLGGFGNEADAIGGSVYSGNDINVWGDAQIDGTLRAGGTISGRPGVEGVSQPGFDFSNIDYSTTADVNVTAELDSVGTNYNSGHSGTAITAPESSPAHMFRRNPSDRSGLCSGTVKDDYFLEDVYEPKRNDSNEDGSNAWSLSFADPVGIDGYRKVFYVDGNLWIDYRGAKSVQVDNTGPEGTQITIVVKGNIYFTDNLFVEDGAADAIAFVAIKDENEADSGNIYFGDPVGGTLSHMHAFMYAENDFYDNHLDSQGQAEVDLIGVMAAGNHVAINRTYQDHHSRLNLDFDERLMNGSVSLPGIPQQSQSLTYEVVSWIELNPDS